MAALHRFSRFHVPLTMLVDVNTSERILRLCLSFKTEVHNVSRWRSLPLYLFPRKGDFNPFCKKKKRNQNPGFLSLKSTWESKSFIEILL